MLHVSITTQANINEKFGYLGVVAVILNACHLVGLINLFYGGKITIANNHQLVHQFGTNVQARGWIAFIFLSKFYIYS